MSTKLRKQRKSFRNVGFSVEEVHAFGDYFAAQLFNQIIWISKNMANGGSFYKFFKPCDHPLCRQGDTWEEFFGVSYYRFNKSLKIFSEKVKKRSKKDPDALVWYWVGMDRVPHFQPNWKAIESFWNNEHPVFKLRNSEGANYVNGTVENTYLAPSQLDITEDNTEENQREGAPAQNSEPLIAKEQSFNNTAPAADPQYLDLFAEVAKEVDPITAERAALLFSTNSQNVEAGIRKLKAAKMNPAEIISDFLLNPKYKNYNVFDLQAQFQRSAGVYARIENNNRPQVGARNGKAQPVSSSARLPRY